MSKPVKRYEHQKLLIGDEGFSKKHWEALVKLNTLHQNKYFSVLHNGLQFKQYVGIIQINNFSIEILPKADKNDANENWQDVLIKMLKACGHLKASSAGGANVKKQNLNLLEVYFDLYLQEVNKLMHSGFVKQYRKQTKNVKALKGKLEFAGNIKHNLVHKERFYTTHQVYDQNHLLHQILKTALNIVSQFSKQSYLNDACRRLELNFPDVDTKQITKSHLENIKLSRKTASYTYALELARLIILNYSPDISSGKERMLSLLFDMNVLWEQYILKKLQKTFENTDYEVSGQESASFIGSNTLVPDIVIRKGKSIYIIDTKWKLPEGKAKVEDLRQMYTYGRFWDAKKLILLYPGSPNNQNYKSFDTKDFYHSGEEITEINHQCKLGFVSVLDNNNELDEQIGEKIKSLMGYKPK